MQRIGSSSTMPFLCDVCNAVFRIPLDQLSGSESSYSVACPTCGRTAEVRRLLNGEFQVEHGEHVFRCPGPLNRNPPVTIVGYLGILAFVVAVFVAVARMVSPVLCPVVLFATLFAVGLIVILQLLRERELTADNFVQLIALFYRTLPVIMGRNAPQGEVTVNQKKPAARKV
jgi:predicted Zn finger-like uncharacterized protein